MSEKTHIDTAITALSQELDELHIDLHSQQQDIKDTKRLIAEHKRTVKNLGGQYEFDESKLPAAE